MGPTAQGTRESVDLAEQQRRAELFGHRLEHFRIRPSQPALPVPPPRSAAPASTAPTGAAPIQAVFDWKKKLLTGAGLGLGAAGLVAGGILGSVPLLAAGGTAMALSALYGRSQYKKAQEEIPNKMHYVWLGGKLPEERQKSIEQWGESAEGVERNLWTDEGSSEASAESLEQLRKSGVKIRSLSELEGSKRFKSARRKLPTVDEEGVNPGAAGALSDVARLEILNQEGGHYMDSDNYSGKNASSFRDMTAPLGFRLGWAKHEGEETFSNDAMSAVPGNKFINDYMDTVYSNLEDEEAVQDILSRDRKRVTTSVMKTTGPQAMRTVPLPISKGTATTVRKEMGDFAESKGVPVLEDEKEGVDISHFQQHNLILSGFNKKMSGKSSELFDQIAYRDSFQRGFGNAWVPKEKED